MSIVKNKWNKENFIKTVNNNCFGHTSNVIVDLVNFSEDTADNLKISRVLKGKLANKYTSSLLFDASIVSV